MGTYTLNIESSDVGLHDVTGDNSSLYPNPNQGEFNLPSAEGPVKIYNLMGALVFETVLINSNQINASALPNGTYFVQTDEHKVFQKLIINK